MTKVIYTKWLASELQENGFPIRDVGRNPNHPEYHCFFFDDSPELQEAITKLTAKKKQK